MPLVLRTYRRLMASAAIAVTAVTIAAPAGAQIMSNPAQWYINNQIYSTRVFNGVVGNAMIADAAKKNGGAASGNASAPASPASPAADPTRFRESADGSFAAALARRGGTGASPDRQQEARRQLDAYVALYKQTAQKDGFPADDLAYAFEYFVVNNYQVYHDLVDLPYEKDPYAKRGRDGFDRIRLMSEKRQRQVTMPQERAVYAQFRASLGANPEIRRMTDAQKQEAAEQLAVMFGVNYAAYMRGVDAGDEAATAQARAMARQGLEKLLGVPVDRIAITDAGLRR